MINSINRDTPCPWDVNSVKLDAKTIPALHKKWIKFQISQSIKTPQEISQMSGIQVRTLYRWASSEHRVAPPKKKGINTLNNLIMIFYKL